MEAPPGGEGSCNVTLMSAALWVVLTATAGEEGAPRVMTLEPVGDSSTASSAAIADAAFDEAPPPPRVNEDARVKHFLGALAGGVVGFGATMAMMPLADAGCGGFFGFGGCLTAGHVVAGMLVPLLTLGGAWLGFELMGGDGGLITPSLALLPAAVVGLLLMNVARDAGAESGLQLLPYVIASGVLLAGGAAIALDQRAHTLNALGAGKSAARAAPGRVALTSLVSGLTLAGGALVTGIIASACRDALCAAVDFGVGTILGAGAMAAVWGVHRAMGGRGGFGAALVGFGLGAAMALGAVGLYAGSQGFTFNPARNTGSAIVLVEVSTVAALFAPMLALEFSHTAAVEASMPGIALSAAPTNGGGMVGAAMRF
jgi:hypothetical protein